MIVLFAGKHGISGLVAFSKGEMMLKARQDGSKPINKILAKLKNVRKTKSGWTARCPCHEDNRNSLSIAEGVDDRVLLYCHAGCATPNIVASVDMVFSDLFAEDEELKRKHRTVGKFNGFSIVKTYDYTDEKGNLLYQVCRTSKKEFPIRRPDGNRGWSWGLGNASPVLYHLSSVIQTIQTGETLFLVEGEKDVERLNSVGLAATTCPMGAGKWREAYNAHLQEAHVVILPDNDEPGKQHAQQITNQLQRLAASIKIIHLPNLQEKEDVSDWLDKYGTTEKLLQLVKEAQDETTEQTDPSSLYLTFLDLKKLLKPIGWTWKGWLPTGLLTIVASEPGIGKSALALRLAASVISGIPWPDGTPYEGPRGKVLWCEAEASQSLNVERSDFWNMSLGDLIIPRLEHPFMKVLLDNPNHRRIVTAIALLEDTHFVIVDSLRGCHSLDENSSESMEIVMWLAELARDTGKPILLTHHLRKRGHYDGDSVNLDRLRGSSAIIQPARVIWAMDTPDPELPEHKRLAVIKSNISKFPPPIGFIVDAYGPEFGEPPLPPKKETLLERAKDRLRAMLQKAPQPANEIFEAFEAEGISHVTVRRAKQVLKIVVFQKDGKWFWSLPISENSIR